MARIVDLMCIEIIKKASGIKLMLFPLIASTLVNSQAFAFEYEMEYSKEVIKEVSKAGTQQEKINIAKRYLAGSDMNNKMQAISILRPLGGEAIPVLLEQLKTELQELQGKEAPLDAIKKENKYSLINYIISSLGHTKDRRIIDPLINIIRANDLPIDIRRCAVENLGIIGSGTPASYRSSNGSLRMRIRAVARKQAKPAAGYEIKELDTEKTENILIEILNDINPSMRIQAIYSLSWEGYIDRNRNIIPKLESIAKEDKYTEEIDASLRGGEKCEKITIYPVREEAEKSLKMFGKQEIKDKDKQWPVSNGNRNASQ